MNTYTSWEEATKALAGAKVMKAFAFAGHALSALGAISTLVDYNNNKINGFHASVNIVVAGVGTFVPGAGTLLSIGWGVFDYYAGNWLFNDGEK